jgi:hypothetical protein
MKLVEGGDEPAFADVGVAIGAGNGCMAEHFLDDAEVSAVVEKVRGKRMAQGVRGDAFTGHGYGRMLFHDLPYSHARDGLSSLSHKQPGGCFVLGSYCQVIVDGKQSRRTDRHEAFFTPLSKDADHPFVQILNAYMAKFGNAESAAVKKL